MMRVLVLGVTGMLGNAIFQRLSANPENEIVGTLRDNSDRRFFSSAANSRIMSGIDVSNDHLVLSAFIRWRPDVVINAIGVVKQLDDAKDPLVVLPLNALFPHRLERLCHLMGCRMIQLSSDCVFAGRSGGYRESDTSDAEDLYGKSKYIGEVHSRDHVITLRTSGIGHELESRNGLLEWFLAQEGAVRGYSRAIYSGLPSVELARIIDEYVLPRPELKGLYHVSAKPITKLTLLRLIAAEYQKKVEIIADESVVVDRSLDSHRFMKATGYMPQEWQQLVAIMRASRPLPG